jgi:hypothetical protein
MWHLLEPFQRLANKLDVDLTTAARRKLRKNGRKYSVKMARGVSRK